LKIESFFSKLYPIKHSKNNFESIQSLSTCSQLKPHTVVFVKDTKFLKTLKTSFLTKVPENLWIIVEEKLFQKLTEEEKNQLAHHADALYLMPNCMLGLCELSRHFFEIKIKQHNDVVDGRQMGTAQVDPDALIAQGVFLGANVKIAAGVKVYPGCVVMSSCEIGQDTILYPNVTLYPDSKIGKNCIIHSGCVIGADGFGYHFDHGKHHKIYHLGGVVLGNEVELGAGTTIDRGTIESTAVASGTKIDNLVHVGHNCQLGEGVILCGQVGLSGSVKIGAYSVLGGKAGVAPDTTIGEQSQIAGMAGVTGNLEKASKVAGHPARPVSEWLRSVAHIRMLSEKKIKAGD
jgi:UDP-3-O-[3-hydroxymyristoyl] glucosamine N-acyltransferase